MKKLIALVPGFLLVVIFSSAQDAIIITDYNDYRDYDNRYDDYRDDGRYRYNYDSRRRNSQRNNETFYRRDNAIYSIMTYNDRKRLRKLERRFRDRVDCALEDGYLSRRDRRRIADVRRDIADLLYKYQRRDRRGNNYRRRNNICF